MADADRILAKLLADIRACRICAKELTHGVRPALTKLGRISKAIIQNAFDTRGFGLWAENSPRTIARKGSDAPLIDHGELRRAVNHDIVGTKS